MIKRLSALFAVAAMVPALMAGVFDGDVFLPDEQPMAVGYRVARRFVEVPHPNFDANPAPTREITYPETCAWIGAIKFAHLTGDSALTESLEDRFLPVLGEERRLQPMPDHVDHSVFGAVPLGLYLSTGNKAYRHLGLWYADRQFEMPACTAADSLRYAPLLESGRSWQTRYWIDDMYMISALQGAAYRVSGDRRYLDRATRQMTEYLDSIQCSNGLFYHAPDAPFHWCRGNGWMAAGMTELLSMLPSDHPHRARIMESYRKMMHKLLELQRPDGLWGQLIDAPEAWSETSGSAMFLYAMISGVKRDWLDSKEFAPAVIRGWKALVARIDSNGDIDGVCEGTNRSTDLMASTVEHWRPEEQYTDRNNRKKHPYEAVYTDKTVVSLDAFNRALGNASCGPDVMEKYELKARFAPFAFMIMPLDEGSRTEQMSEKANVSSPVCSPVEIVANSDGTVSMSSATPSAGIMYDVDGSGYKEYTAPVYLPQGGLVSAYAVREGYYDSAVTSARIGLFVDKSLWSVASVSSEQDGNEKAANAIDGDNSSIWHTAYGSSEPRCPHEIVVDMGRRYRLSELIYQGRTDGSNGRIKAYEVYVGDNPGCWGAPAARGELTNTPEQQSIALPLPEGRYFKLVALSEVNGNAWASAAELSVIATEQLDDAVDTDYYELAPGASYAIREQRSDRCLQVKTGDSEGGFALGLTTPRGDDYEFVITPVPGFTSYYTIKGKNGYMNKGEGGWRIVPGDVTDNADGWMRLEYAGDGLFRLCAMWQSNQYLNFDRFGSGACVYANKAEGACFRLEDFEQAGIGSTAHKSAARVFPTVTSGEVNIEPVAPSVASLVNVTGSVVRAFDVPAEGKYFLSVPDSVYLLTLVTADHTARSTHKIVVRH